MQRLSYPTETVLINKITRIRILLPFKDSPTKPFGRRPDDNMEKSAVGSVLCRRRRPMQCNAGMPDPPSFSTFEKLLASTTNDFERRRQAEERRQERQQQQ